MVSDEEVARHLSENSLQAARLLNDMLFLAQAKCPESEFAPLRLAVGEVLGDLLLGVLNPLYRRHPALKPAGLDVL
jgi:hypothetical protein